MKYVPTNRENEPYSNFDLTYSSIFRMDFYCRSLVILDNLSALPYFVRMSDPYPSPLKQTKLTI